MAGTRARRPKVLTPVGLTDDGFGILLSADPEARPSHLVRIDADLVARLDEARDRLEPVDHERGRLPPKEIQALLRRGEAVEDVARRAGLPVAWVERFATPIEWERAGMAGRARRAVLHRPRLGPSALPLGDAVRHHVSLDDDAFEAAWDAVHAPGEAEEWVVTFVYRARGARRKARWAYSPRSGDVRALNRAAADLAWISPRSTA